MKWSIIIAFVAGIPGAILTFVDPRTLVAWGLGFGRHNDRVLAGVLLLIIAFVSICKFLTLLNTSTAEKPARKNIRKKSSRKK
ncbi:hypothetical protein HY492_01590 [Candidatus Woesearchaeota archaeon]|nr:hypothetical protein [Candidatus Woesearchaeota archaeon]